MATKPTNSGHSSTFACQEELIGLFETLINVMFSVKDLDGSYVEVNSAFVRRTGKNSKRDVIGTRATDHFIPELAERYEEQDRKVFETGEPLLDKLELIKRPNGELGWYLTTKLPVADRSDPATLVGLVSVSRDLLTPSDENIALEHMADLVVFVKENLGRQIRVKELAEVAQCSDTQLERRMKRVFGCSPTQYILKVRVEAAARMLTETTEPISDIAGTCGFYDQPDFTRRFARLTNHTPAQFRKLNAQKSS